LHAGLFSEDDIAQLPLVRDAFAEVDAKYPGLDPMRRRHEALRRVFGMMVSDVIETSARHLDAAGAQSSADIRHLGRPVIRFSDGLWEALTQIRAFLFTNMYRAPKVMKKRAEVTRVVEAIFPLFMDNPALLPQHWLEDAGQAPHDDQTRARMVADYIAGMTDRFALKEYDRLAGA
jgi:dGTPase